jgi:predicted PurR-regulated permease PerM
MDKKSLSPEWSATVKAIVVATLLVVLAFSLVRFQNIIPPLLIAFIITYLLHPLASLMERKLRMPWSLSVAVIFAALVVVILGLLVLGGFELVAQFQNSLALIQMGIESIPLQVQNIPVQNLSPGPLKDLLQSIDLTGLSGQLVGYIEPTLGRAGSLLGTLATGAFSTLGWLFFIFLVSYFLLAETGGFGEQVLTFDLREYNDDAKRFGTKLSRIWNAFLRGQLIIVFLAIAIYALVLNIYGINYALGLALLAGLARFLPYVGPPIVWCILALVAYFQDYKLFGMAPFSYALLVVVTAMVIDYVLDNLVYTRVMADTLKVHPAAILVAVLIAADFLGLLGVLIAAPILATLQLILTYIVRKLFNEDPWPPENEKPPFSLRDEIKIWLKRIRASRKIA